MTESFSLQINHSVHTVTCAPGTSLLSLLRQQGCMGVHRVCETGDCGSCTVWVEDQAVHSCIYPAVHARDRQVTTIEGLVVGDRLSPMQAAFLADQGFQCGYCTPGMIMSASHLCGDLSEDIRSKLDGNLCRCTGYQAIVASIQKGQVGLDTPKIEAPSADSPIGQSIPKQDGLDIVTGKPVYTADWTPDGLLHLKVLRSPHAHAIIRHIDTRAAAVLPGVHAVFTHQDVPRRPYSTAGHGEPVPDPLDHYLLDTKVRFVGDRVAAVVADSVAIAEQACDLIQVDYEILPHVLDPIAAMGGLSSEILNPPPGLLHDESDSRQIHDAKRNLAGEVSLEKGDLSTGFAEAEIVLERTYTLPAVQHFHLEPHITTSWIDADGMLTVRSSTQVPFHCQRILAELFDLPRDRVRVFKTKIGGGFGNKQEILTEDLCVLATLHTGRPVQWELTRHEEFTATTSRHAMQIQLKVGAKRTGQLTAVDMTAIANTGAYGNHGTQVVFLTGTMPLGLYRCANQRYRGLSVYTNTMPAGAFRGYGATQGCFAMECLMDELAQHLHLDPWEFRRQQIITPNDEILLGQDHHFHLIGGYGLDEAIAQVIQALNYQPHQPPKVEGVKRRGKGLAIAMQGSGLAKIHEAQVQLSLQANGRYELRTGSVDVGTGSDTSLRQIAAGILKTTVPDIDLIAADTHSTPFDSGSYASATLYISGYAVKLAAEDLRSRLLSLAADELHTHPDALTLHGDRISSTEASLTLADLAQQVLTHSPSDRASVLTIERSYSADSSSLTFAVQGVEVEVDTETGRITVLRAVQAIDIGKAINPRICEGQATGGMVMGLGYALQEELRWNPEGRILNPTPRTYRIPLAKEVPPMQVILIEQGDPFGPLGAKGIGEIGVNGMAPAIANAVAHATGIRFTQLPMTPERVWRSVQEAIELP